MKRVVLTLLVIALFTGCATTPRFSTENAQLVSAITRPTVQTLVVPLLTRKPEYESALLALAAGADVVFSRGELDVATLRGYVEALALKYGIAENDKLIITLAVTNVYQFYVDTYQRPVMDATDPNVKLVVSAFSKGIREGIAFFHAYNSAKAEPAVGAPF